MNNLYIIVVTIGKFRQTHEVTGAEAAFHAFHHAKEFFGMVGADEIYLMDGYTGEILAEA